MRAIILNSVEAPLPTTSSGTTLNSALLVRIVTSASGTVYRLNSASGTVLGSCTVISTEPTYIFKDPTDVLYASSADLKAASINFMY